MRGDRHYKAYLTREDFDHVFKIVIVREIDGEVEKILRGKEWVDYTPFEAITPTLELSKGTLNALLKCLLEFANNENIRTDSEEKITGKLEATLYHLEDLRSLLKLVT